MLQQVMHWNAAVRRPIVGSNVALPPLGAFRDALRFRYSNVSTSHATAI
jgi:hypothetical protein